MLVLFDLPSGFGKIDLKIEKEKLLFIKIVILLIDDSFSGNNFALINLFSKLSHCLFKFLNSSSFDLSIAIAKHITYLINYL